MSIGYKKDPNSPACAKCASVTFVLERPEKEGDAALCMNCDPRSTDKIPLIRYVWRADYRDEIPTKVIDVPFHGPTCVEYFPFEEPR